MAMLPVSSQLPVRSNVDCPDPVIRRLAALTFIGFPVAVPVFSMNSLGR